MARSIAGVVIGYLVMGVLVFATFFGAYAGMGAERALQPGSFEPSAAWIATSFILGLLAAVAGGWACAAIAKSARAVKAFAGIVLVLGFAMAVPAISAKEAPKTRTAAVGIMEAMQQTQTPVWVAFLNPLVAVAGISLGARRRQPRSA